MGNTPSNQQTQQDLYSTYIQQQQDLIFKQQQQINELYRYNLQSNQQVPPNMMFQSDFMNHQQNQQNQSNLPQLPNPNKLKLDPYKILGISKNFDEKILKKAYLKMAMKTHPDRGGSQDEFQKVSIAYTILTKKLKEENNNHSHNDLRDQSREYSQQQMNQPKINVNMRDNFDANLFNKIYEDNKISDVYDEGYGDWMNKNLTSENQQKLFQNGFNKDMFNSTFEQYKKEHQEKNKNQLVKYGEPETRISMKNQDSLVTLGQGKITDFSGEANNLSFTDYKKAYTYGSTLIDTSSVDISGRSGSMKDMKMQRSNISYQMTPQDQQRVAIQRLQEQKEEEKRLNRLNVYDQKHGQVYEKIHSMLLR
jgi:curved DNA-binding protein CbpA